MSFYEFIQNKYITETDGEGQLRMSQGKDVNVTPRGMIVARNLHKLEKDKAEGKISEEEYEKRKSLIENNGKKNIRNFLYDTYKNASEKYHSIPDSRETPTRHAKKHGRPVTDEMLDNDTDTYDQRQIKRLVSTPNFSGVNRTADGEHKTTFRQFAKMQDRDPNGPIYATPQYTAKTVSNKTQNMNPVQGVDELYRVSNATDASYARPSNKSTDGVIYPQSRIYAATNVTSAQKESPPAQNGINTKTTYTLQTNPNDKIMSDVESPSGNSVFIPTTYKRKVQKAETPKDDGKKKVDSILNSFYGNLM